MKNKNSNSVQFAKVLADTTRQKIMDMLCCDELNVSEVAEKAGIKQPTATHHLSVLRKAGLVTMRTEGKSSIYTLNQERIVNCCGTLIEKFAPDSKMTIVVKNIKD